MAEAVSTVEQRRDEGTMVTHARMNSRFLAKKIPRNRLQGAFRAADLPESGDQKSTFCCRPRFREKKSCAAENSLDLPHADNHVRGMPFCSGHEDRTGEPLQLGGSGLEHWRRAEIDKGWIDVLAGE